MHNIQCLKEYNIIYVCASFVTKKKKKKEKDNFNKSINSH